MLLFFGDGFAESAAPVLQVLVVGQLFNLLMAPGGYLLSMTGNERCLRNMLMFSTIVMMLASAIFIPVYDAVGAAMAVTLSVIVHKLGTCLFVRREVGMPFFLLLTPSN